ncbi:hypothetical protein MMC22_001646 [Lobaria immixta]|nr:hypothetical protein [Lobaria immixta]
MGPRLVEQARITKVGNVWIAANDTQYRLSSKKREYLIADYERQNVSISQCSWDPTAKPNIIAIPSKDSRGKQQPHHPDTGEQQQTHLKAGAIAGIPVATTASLSIIALLIHSALKRQWFFRIRKTPQGHSKYLPELFNRTDERRNSTASPRSCISTSTLRVANCDRSSKYVLPSHSKVVNEASRRTPCRWFNLNNGVNENARQRSSAFDARVGHSLQSSPKGADLRPLCPSLIKK